MILGLISETRLRWRHVLARRWAGIDDWIDARFGGHPNAAAAQRFKPDSAAIEEAPIPLPAFSALYIVVALVLIALLWAIFGAVDRIVVASGKITTTAPLIVMQPFTTSRILKVRVRAGDSVKKGQVLITFDPAFAKADETSLTQKVAALNAEIARIEAELSGAKTFTAAPGDGPERQVQAQLFSQRTAQFAAEMAVRDGRLGQIDSQIAEHKKSFSELGRQLEMAKNVTLLRNRLEAQKAGSHLESMMAEKDEIDSDLKLKSTIADTNRLEQQRAETVAERQSYLRQWRADLNQKLVTDRQDAAAASEELNKAHKMQELTALRAPMDGVVLELAERSEGSVLREAETLITLVPANATLNLEANIPSRDIGYVKVGDPVQIKLEAYPFQQFGTLEGRLDVVSPDSLALKEGESTTTVFRAQVQLKDTIGTIARRGMRLRPGLVATADIRSGRRTIFSYLADPLRKTAQESLREP